MIRRAGTLLAADLGRAVTVDGTTGRLDRITHGRRNTMLCIETFRGAEYSHSMIGVLHGDTVDLGEPVDTEETLLDSISAPSYRSGAA